MVGQIGEQQVSLVGEHGRVVLRTDGSLIALALRLEVRDRPRARPQLALLAGSTIRFFRILGSSSGLVDGGSGRPRLRIFGCRSSSLSARGFT